VLVEWRSSVRIRKLLEAVEAIRELLRITDTSLWAEVLRP
jgi:hypothetical protein